MATTERSAAVERPAEMALPFLGRLHEWVVTTDHKRLGLMYIASGLVFFLVAGLEASFIRLQLALPNNDVLSPQVFNRLMTMHGTTMVFFVGMPILLGFANYLVPLMIGARDMAFPRLNAFSFWLSLFGSLLLYFSFLGAEGLYGGGSAPDVGWFAYAPLTSRAFSPGNSTDYWNLSLLVSGVGSVGTAINLIVTVLCLRCPGMTLAKMPLLVWLYFVVACQIVLIMPPLTAAQIMLLLDRFLGAHFFDTQHGGSAVLWQHFFWIFGHPEVYVLMLPGFAFASEIIPVFSRKVIFGYPVMVAATVSIGFISLGVWAHHMFAVGLEPAANTFFAVSTMLIAVPTGIKIFNWLGTMWGGKIRFDVAMLFCTGFLFQFLCAGLTGVMLAAVPFDWQLTDSYFVVAHFHYVLIGGLLFTIFAAIYYWFPKATGRLLDERLGRWHFWLFTVGFNLTFAPQHISGILGMPRRIYTYDTGRGWETWNLISSLGVAFQLAGVLFFLWNVVHSLRRGEAAGGDPWDAWTLEWSTTSPPPEYNFAEMPVVRSRRPLWDLKHPDDPDWRYEDAGAGDWGLGAGERGPGTGGRGPGEEGLSKGRVGIAGVIAAESSIFVIFVIAYLYYVGKSVSGPLPAQVLERPILASILLLSSSLTITLAVRALRAGRRGGFALWWGATFLLGGAFLVATGLEWWGLIYDHGLTIGTNLFGTTYYSLVGLHASHVVVGLVLLGTVLALALRGHVHPAHAERAEVLSLYWHFVDGVWLVVFTVVYVIGM